MLIRLTSLFSEKAAKRPSDAPLGSIDEASLTKRSASNQQDSVIQNKWIGKNKYCCITQNVVDM